ncbi:MAG: HEPN domain-containing protein [Dysgonamonadaceae bacterium]|nr:HEPN domain-containing protein [Dysgonamonadaceae bacterium]
MYYACFYAVNALLMSENLYAKTHDGTATLFNLHFVLKEKISKEKGKLFKILMSKRETGDYDYLFSLEEQDVAPLLEPAKDFIEAIEKLIRDAG